MRAMRHLSLMALAATPAREGACVPNRSFSHGRTIPIRCLYPPQHLRQASGRRVYLQLKSGDSYLEARKDGREAFRIKKARWAEYWTAQESPVMLVIRTSDGQIRWMNVTEYWRQQMKQGTAVKQIVFDGEPFTATNLWRLRDRLLR